MKHLRILIAVLVLTGGGALVFYLVANRPESSLHPTMAPFFQLVGKSTELGDKLIAKVIPVNDLDEKELGEVIAYHISWGAAASSETNKYLHDLIEHLSRHAKKPFTYSITVIGADAPNACAFPGGVLVVTRGLLSLVQSESELAAILGHEIGHVELGHCFGAVKFELLSRKFTQLPLGEIADIANNLLVRSSFSKTQENDADEYAYQLLLQTEYDPRGEGNAFKRLMEFDSTSSHSDESFNVLRDYFRSHPPTKLRFEKFSEKANQWWKRHQGTARYRGEANLREKVSFYSRDIKEEWVTH